MRLLLAIPDASSGRLGTYTAARDVRHFKLRVADRAATDSRPGIIDCAPFRAAYIRLDQLQAAHLKTRAEVGEQHA